MDVETKAQALYYSISPIKHHQLIIIVTSLYASLTKSKVWVYQEFFFLSRTYHRCHIFFFPIFLTLSGEVAISFNFIMESPLFLFTCCMVIECLWDSSILWLCCHLKKPHCWGMTKKKWKSPAKDQNNPASYPMCPYINPIAHCT